MRNLSRTEHYVSPATHKIKKRQRGPVLSVDTVQWYPCDNGLFTISGMDKTLQIWDTTSLRCIETYKFNGKVYHHQICPSISCSSVTAVATNLDYVSLIDFKIGPSVQQVYCHSKGSVSCQWSPTNEYLLASGGFDGTIYLCDIRSTKSSILILDRHTNLSTDINQCFNYLSHAGMVNGLSFTEDGRFLVSFGHDNRLRLWNTSNGQNQMINYEVHSNKIHKHIQLGVSTHTTVPYLYVPTENDVQVYELLTGKWVQELKGHYNIVTSCCYNLFTKELYTAGLDRNILVWAKNPLESKNALVEEY